ncbi:hypothetical protein VE03_03015 [Pseudogymnoascus sp. 23342-1-I1]|nr:hypothetical protein VE03_03015 [Pseudogymnoascus sp. 23342-1-I1]
MNLKDYAGGDPPYVPSDGRMNWEEAVLPPASEEVCVLRKLHMDIVPTEELNPDIDDSLTAYCAKLDFFLPRANKTISLTLYTNSIFVAAPPCNGTHKIDPEYAELYARTIYEVSELDALEIKINEITVINATGQGTQAVARAWCSEQGTNAVILNRDKGCCFKCGLMVAGKEGADVDVLILC